jgi:hypothetical protein
MRLGSNRATISRLFDICTRLQSLFTTTLNPTSNSPTPEKSPMTNPTASAGATAMPKGRTDWTPGGVLTLWEEYNGLGYAARGVPSA